MRKWIKKMLMALLKSLMTRDNALAMIRWAAPLAREAILRRMSAPDQAKIPTEAELLADMEDNVDTYLAEGKAWLEAHPPGG